MRIAINAVSAVTGGGMTYLVNLLKYLPPIMPNDEFLVFIQGIELPNELLSIQNLEIRKISEETSSQNVFKRFLWENISLIKESKKWKADILYCVANLAPLAPIGLPTYVMLQNVAPITPKVLFTILRYEGIKSFLKMFAISILTLFSCIKSDKVLVLSKDSDRLLKSWIPFAKTQLVHHGVNIKRPEIPLNYSEPYFLFVSNIYVYKGLEFIIDAYLHKKNLPKTYIIGHGYDENYTNTIKDRIKDYNLEEKMIFLDSLPYTDLPKWYSKAIANVFPTWCESFGCGIIEAQACGCPIVGFNCCTLPEFCHQSAILVEPQNGKALAEGMEKAIELIKDKNLPSKLIEYAQNFNWEKAMLRHKEIFSISS